MNARYCTFTFLFMHVMIQSMSPDLPTARRDLIADRLANGAAVVASELAAEFSVSEDAIRRDLRALAAEGRCRRVYGGALPISPASSPMSARMDEGREQKAALGRVAATTVAPGELIFLDNGSTNLAVVDYLPEDHDLTIATNSIDIAAAVLRRPELKLIMVGGCVDPVVGGAIDATATTSVSQMNIDRCFLGACSVSATHGVCAFNAADAALKRVLVAASRCTVVLATPDKFRASAPYRVAESEAIQCFVVSHDIEDGELEALTNRGCTVLKTEASF